ncbi:ribokinase [Christensenellaceae bacterium NSJ-63]|uniref:Ribokinase n=1 Tax=Guopingia tenuis TaxID=2763656 RepID=A0A926HVT9_9FIRM|nr:ribokinase [Guopingia tenuis]MBC8538309.1 ribokinase [Guopingia tenuis]MBS5644212.1 ribokinase [Clostridiales bacterium]
MITVVGSFVVDLMSRTPHMPVAGETVLGGPFRMGPGGKGGNQAVAAARCGSPVNMVTKLGKDDFGEMAKRTFLAENINIDYTPIDPEEATGAALIIVEQSSENMIVVALGACGKLSREDIYKAEDAISKSDIVLTQLETSVEAVVTTVEIAKKHGVPVILNTAPYQEFPKEILKDIAYVTPNETEAGYLSGIPVVDDDSALKAAAAIQAMGVKTVIITMGKRGCLLFEGPEKYEFVPSFKLDNVVDTTGAGDAFNGGFAHAIATGMSLKEAARFASAVAGLSVTKIGTAPAMPRIEDVEAFLAAH